MGAVETTLIGSAHSGRRGDFRTQLFTLRRSAASRESWEVSFVQADGPTPDMRFMGLANHNDTLFAVAGSAEATFLATFDSGLRQTGWHPLLNAADPHGLVVDDERLWVVSSRTNSVMQYELSSIGPRTAKLSYRHPEIASQHFNGLTRHNGKLVLSAFGASAEEVRTTSATGYLIDIETDAIIVAGLDQPHSPYTHGGSLWFCESHPSEIWKDAVRVARLEGYLRGLCCSSDDHLHVVENAPRPPRNTTWGARTCPTIWTLNIGGSFLDKHKLEGIEPEVYDLLAMAPA